MIRVNLYALLALSVTFAFRVVTVVIVCKLKYHCISFNDFLRDFSVSSC